MSASGDKASTARSPEEVLRQARIAHSNRVASLAQVHNVVDKHTRQRRASLVRLQYDKDRSPFSLLDATALAGNGENGFSEVLETMYGDPDIAAQYVQNDAGPAVPAPTGSKPIGNSSCTSSLGSPAGTATISGFSAQSSATTGGSFGAHNSDCADKEGRAIVVLDPDPDPKSKACTTASHARTAAATDVGSDARALVQAGLVATPSPRVAPAIAWGESVVRAACGWTPDPTAAAPQQQQDSGDALAHAVAAIAPGSMLSALMAPPSPSASPVPGSPSWFRSPRASAPSGALVPSPRSGLAPGCELADPAGGLPFRSPLGSSGGALSHSSPLPVLPSPLPRQHGSQPLIELSPPPSPQPIAAATHTSQSCGRASPLGHAVSGALLAQPTCSPSPALRPSSQQSRYADRAFGIPPALLLPSIGASPPAALVLSPASPASPGSRASPGSPGGSPAGTGAWRLAAPSAREREHGRNLAAPAKAPTVGGSGLGLPSSPPTAGLSECSGPLPVSRRGSVMGTPDDTLAVMRSAASFSARRRAPSTANTSAGTGNNSGRHTPLLRPSSRGLPLGADRSAHGASLAGGQQAGLEHSPPLHSASRQAPAQPPPKHARELAGVLAPSERPDTGGASVGSAAGLSSLRLAPRLAVPLEGGEGGRAAVADCPERPVNGLQADTMGAAAAGPSASAGTRPQATASGASAVEHGEGSGTDAAAAASAFSSPLPAPMQLPAPPQLPAVHGVGCLFQAEFVGRRRHVSESSGQWTTPAQPSPPSTPLRSPLHMGAAPDGAALLCGTDPAPP